MVIRVPSNSNWAVIWSVAKGSARVTHQGLIEWNIYNKERSMLRLTAFKKVSNWCLLIWGIKMVFLLFKKDGWVWVTSFTALKDWFAFREIMYQCYGGTCVYRERNPAWSLPFAGERFWYTTLHLDCFISRSWVVGRKTGWMHGTLIW